MDIITLTTTALTLMTPFLTKVAEGSSRKIGEDLWNLIKKPFLKKNQDIDKLSQEEFKAELIKLLEEDCNFKNELENYIDFLNSQSTIQQNIQNEGAITKQVNIGSNIGNISL